MTRVAGADVSKGSWVAVVLTAGRFDQAQLAPSLAALSELIGEVAVLALDIPIGLPGNSDDWPRPSDIEARRAVGPRWSSVFFAPPRRVYDEPSYSAANGLHRALTSKGFSRQCWALREKVLEAERFVAKTATVVIEVHPEVSFRAMRGAPIGSTKRTWNGQNERRRLLHDNGIDITEKLEASAGKVPPDDLLDAAAAAWSAHRFAEGEARSLPDLPAAEADASVQRIWY